MMKRKYSSCSGSALWIILLAIALMAALTVVIMRTSDTTEQSKNNERMRIQASAMLRYADSLAKAVQRMNLNGISENDISFENDTVPGYANANCLISDCRLFDTSGGSGLAYRPPPENTNDGSPWLFTGANNITGVNTDGGGPATSSDNELMVILPRVDPALCERINIELGMSSTLQDTAKADIATKFTGSFPDGQTIDQPAGTKAGCFEGNQDGAGTDISGTYYFYYTLIDR